MAMLANGPACTNTGCPSMVCIRFGLMAFTIHAVMAPSTSRSAVVISLPFLS